MAPIKHGSDPIFVDASVLERLRREAEPADSVEIGAGPFRGSARGAFASYLLIAIVFLGVVLYFVHLRTSAAADSDTLILNRIREVELKLDSEILENRRVLAETGQKMLTALDEQTYLMSITSDQQQKIRLNMPDSLRRKIVGVPVK